MDSQRHDKASEKEPTKYDGSTKKQRVFNFVADMAVLTKNVRQEQNCIFVPVLCDYCALCDAGIAV